MQFTITQTCETILDIEIVKKDDKFFAKVKRDYLNMNEYECWICNKYGDADLMTEPVGSDEEYEAIIKTFCSYIKENGINYARKCTCCGKGMNEGFFADYEYFCNEDCLYTEYTPVVWEKLASDGVEDEEGNDCYYWTEWDTNNCEYVLFNNQLINI